MVTPFHKKKVYCLEDPKIDPPTNRGWKFLVPTLAVKEWASWAKRRGKIDAKEGGFSAVRFGKDWSELRTTEGVTVFSKYESREWPDFMRVVPKIKDCHEVRVNRGTFLEKVADCAALNSQDVTFSAFFGSQNFLIRAVDAESEHTSCGSQINAYVDGFWSATFNPKLIKRAVEKMTGETLVIFFPKELREDGSATVRFRELEQPEDFAIIMSKRDA